MFHEQEIQVRYAETGIGGRLKPACILNYFQDAASDHCAKNHVSAVDLFEKDLAWIVFRYQIEIDRYPSWKEHLKIRTWRYPDKNLYELRRYDVFDKSGNAIIRAKSAWIVINLKNRKPVRLNRNLPSTMMTAEPVIENSFPDITSPERIDFTRTFTTRMHDLDFNRHVNNAVFIIWALESVPPEIARNFLPVRISVHYIGEALFGERITARTTRLETNPNPGFIHRLMNPSGQEITRIMTAWMRLDE